MRSCRNYCDLTSKLPVTRLSAADGDVSTPIARASHQKLGCLFTACISATQVLLWTRAKEEDDVKRSKEANTSGQGGLGEEDREALSFGSLYSFIPNLISKLGRQQPWSRKLTPPPSRLTRGNSAVDLQSWLWKDPNVTRKAMAHGGTLRKVPGTGGGVSWDQLALENRERERIHLEKNLGAETLLVPSLGGTSVHNWILSQG